MCVCVCPCARARVRGAQANKAQLNFKRKPEPLCLGGKGQLEINRAGRTYQGLAGVIRLEQGRSGIS